MGGARNRGFDAATGEFVLYVDSDDWIDPAYCERLYEAARETGADVACASMLKIRPSYSKWTIRYTERQVVADVQEKFRVCRCPPDSEPTVPPSLSSSPSPSSSSMAR